MSAINSLFSLAAQASKWSAKPENAISRHSNVQTEWLGFLGLLLLAVPLTVQAQYTYTINSGGSSITITGYTGSGGAVTIPGSINSLPVVSIAEYAFYSKVNLTSVTIPNTVTNIGILAFGFASLTTVVIGDGVTTIGTDAFDECDNLTSIYFLGNAPSVGTGAFYDDPATLYYLFGTTGWSSFPLSVVLLPFNYTMTSNAITITGYTGSGGAVTIPSSINALPVVSIAEYGFYDCTSLTSVIIPNSVTNIGNYAFQNCTNLSSFTIPNSVTSMGIYVFDDCTSLTSVTIPNSVSSIGDYAFQNCTSLTNVFFTGNAPNADSTVFASLPSGTYDPATIYYFAGTMGWNSTFAGLPTVALLPFNYLTTGNTVTITGYIASGGTASIPSSINGLPVTSIGNQAFYDCTTLTNVTIPNSVTNIAAYAFEDCSGLTSVTIPKSVASIGSAAFWLCNSLTSVYFNGNAPNAGINVFYGDSATIYYLPGTTGWGSAFAGLPAVLWNPLIQTSGGNLGVQNNKFGFTITGIIGLTVVVEACTNLASPVWTPLQSVTLTNGSFYFSEPLQTNSSARYYSLQMP